MNMKLNFHRSLIVALAFAIVAGVAGVGFYRSVSAQTDAVKAVTDVLTQEAAAVEKGDLAALDKIWANSEEVTVFESGHANYGWNDYRNTHLAPELKAFKNTKYAFSDMKVKVDGKTAWATFKYTLAADMGARKVESGGLGTAILEKREGKWRIVHWHSSAPRRAPAPSPSPSPKG
jgi:ketosteroid isomerase-like protein